jgi:hypothetical protein
MTRLLSLCIALLLLTAGGATAATLYQVELVVFTRDSADAEVEEKWDRDHGLRYPSRLVGLLPADAPTADGTVATFRLLPASQLRLGADASTIDRRSNLRVLFHGAWIQPGGTLGDTDAVLISGGKRYGRHHELEGYVTLTVERYLRLDTNLWMSRFAVAGGLPSTDAPVLPRPRLAGGTGAAAEESADTYSPSQIYVMDQERRMRSGELHYLDHPRFGALVQVTPYRAPQPQPAPEAEAPATAPAVPVN